MIGILNISLLVTVNNLELLTMYQIKWNYKTSNIDNNLNKGKNMWFHLIWFCMMLIIIIVMIIVIIIVPLCSKCLLVLKLDQNLFLQSTFTYLNLLIYWSKNNIPSVCCNLNAVIKCIFFKKPQDQMIKTWIDSSVSCLCIVSWYVAIAIKRVISCPSSVVNYIN